MKPYKQKIVLFTVGGIGYGLLELLWRGYTHWSMLLTGGSCFVFFARVAQNCRDRTRLYKAVLCAGFTTAVELIFGVIFNLIFKKKVWDYSNRSFHFLGQVCPMFTALWGVIGLLTMPLASKMQQMLKRS